VRHPGLDFSQVSRTDLAYIAAVTSRAITSEDRALGFFTRRNLRRLSAWPDWQRGEFKQLDRMRNLGSDVAAMGLLGLPPFTIKWHPHIPLVWSSLYSVSSLRLPLPIV
jgi:hypothetical protein